MGLIAAIIITSSIGVVSAVDPVTNDGKKTTFALAFNHMNMTCASTGNGGTPLTYYNIDNEMVMYSEKASLNNFETRTGVVLIDDQYYQGVGTIVNGKTDSQNLEATILFTNSACGQAIVKVNAECNVLWANDNPSPAPITINAIGTTDSQGNPIDITIEPYLNATSGYSYFYTLCE